jgi:hypothetical protein
MKFIHAKMRFIHMKSFIYGHIHPCRWIIQSSKFKLHIHAQAILLHATISFLLMISTSFIRNSSMDYLSCGQSNFASIDHFFIIIINLSKLSTPNLQCRKLVNTPTMLEKYSSFNLGPMNPQNLSNHKRNIWKLCFMGLPPNQR